MDIEFRKGADGVQLVSRPELQRKKYADDAACERHGGETGEDHRADDKAGNQASSAQSGERKPPEAGERCQGFLAPPQLVGPAFR